MALKVVVSCQDAWGVPNFVGCTVHCTEEQYSAGEHYSRALNYAVENGYDTKDSVVYDERDGFLKWLFENVDTKQVVDV